MGFHMCQQYYLTCRAASLSLGTGWIFLHIACICAGVPVSQDTSSSINCPRVRCNFLPLPAGSRCEVYPLVSCHAIFCMPLQNLHVLAFGWLTQYFGGFTAVSFTEMVGTTEEDACGSILVLSNLKLTWLEPNSNRCKWLQSVVTSLNSTFDFHVWLERYG